MSTGPGARSMAEILATRIRSDREDQLEEMIQRLTELDAADDLAQLDENTRGWRQSEWSARHDNPVDGLIAELIADVMAAMADLTDRPERLARVFVVTLKQESVAARLRQLADGSALVYFSDATLTLCQLYAGCAAEGLTGLYSGGRLRDLWRVAKSVRDHQRLGADPALLGGLLRYYLVNQRIYALAAKLSHRLTPSAEPLGVWLTAQAVTFVLGHEIAHHVLDHRPAASDSPPADDLSACPLSEQQEFEADLLGYRAAVHVGRRDVARMPAGAGVGADLPEIGAALGALIGMLAIHVTEQGLFIRRGRSHPPAPARAARLLDEFSDRVRRFAEPFQADLLRATRDAADFSASGRSFDPAWFHAQPQVSTPLPLQNLQNVSILDRFQCRTRADHAAVLVGIGEISPFSPAAGAHAGLAGDARGALLGWGVPEATTDELCAEHRALEFSTLVARLRVAFAARGVPEKALLAGSLAGAQLLAPLLSRGEHPPAGI
ncbi:hypothetical protein Acy02nite_72350 [Actinoplanes cyaneus]|uniref:Uncharacterized protein n=1 Tax=Actinoplanes cyaneus TaxID=52696 RepID=A0A919IPE1_9ACTN|nr:hypothetical protein [Actinoplanes cyaneus]MCW2142334.1 hypothetical protein [Actinoplanes cyaneus]GID69354.1 hypothetical protein Acy02nite_72350 [Actinoplanes cyaneus]